jgi:hypothetical protein
VRASSHAQSIENRPKQRTPASQPANSTKLKDNQAVTTHAPAGTCIDNALAGAAAKRGIADLLGAEAGRPRPRPLT